MHQGWQGLLNMTSVGKILGCTKKNYAFSCVWRWITLEMREVVMPLCATVMFTAKGAAFRVQQVEQL